VEFRKGRHSVSRLKAHLVFVTKYRRGILDDAAMSCLHDHVAKVCGGMDGVLIACDGATDHVHLLIEYPPKLSISVIVNALKGSSSYVLRRERPDIAARYWHGVLWTPAYFAGSTGGATLETVKQYIEQQPASSMA
jgi:putative transposase